MNGSQELRRDYNSVTNRKNVFFLILTWDFQSKTFREKQQNIFFCEFHDLRKNLLKLTLEDSSKLLNEKSFWFKNNTDFKKNVNNMLLKKINVKFTVFPFLYDINRFHKK